MSSRSLLLVLLVLSCLQTFTAANNGDTVKLCCFEHQRSPIPVGLIEKYEITRRDCTHPGVIFTTVNGCPVCADPDDHWVQNIITKLTPASQNSKGSDVKLCCFEHHRNPIPVGLIAKYETTRPECTVPGVILTLKKGFRVCAHPNDTWVQYIMKKLDKHK